MRELQGVSGGLLRPLLCILALLIVPAASAQLTRLETDLVRHVDAQVPAALALLEESVRINSGTMNFEGVRQVGQLFAREFAAVGFTTHWLDGAEWSRAGHLLATSGDHGLHFLLIGHLDTVFEPSSPFQEYEKLDGMRARGPGSTDMKGGNVIMLVALRALRDAGVLQRCRVTVILIGDEEKAGHPLERARRDLIAAAAAADIAIGFEDGDGDPRTAVIARRGASAWALEVTGKAAHSSQVFRQDIGAGAILECARILAAFEDSLRGEPYLTFNPGMIVGGTQTTVDTSANRGTAFGKSNVIAQNARVTGDLRSLSIPQRERAKRTMLRIAADNGPHTSAVLEFLDGYPPMAPSEGNRQLLAMLDRASQDLGLGAVQAVDPARAGAADVSFAAELVDMAIDGVGLMGSGGHTVQEIADLATLPVQAKRIAVLIARLVARSQSD